MKIQLTRALIGRNLQHMHSFRIEQQPSRAMLQPNILISTDESSHISNAVENICSDPHSPRYTTQDSAVPIHVSPTVASVRLRQSPSHSYNDVPNPPTNGTVTHNVRNMVDVHDMLQPILPVRDNIEHPQTDTTNLVDIHDMIQPIPPAQAFSSFDGLSNGDIGDMVNVHDMLQPILPVPACESFDGQSQSNMVGMAELHNMAPSIPPTQALRQMDRPVPTMDDRMFVPRMTESQNMRTQNTFCNPFSQVSAT